MSEVVSSSTCWCLIQELLPPAHHTTRLAPMLCPPDCWLLVTTPISQNPISPVHVEIHVRCGRVFSSSLPSSPSHVSPPRQGIRVRDDWLYQKRTSCLPTTTPRQPFRSSTPYQFTQQEGVPLTTRNINQIGCLAPRPWSIVVEVVEMII